MTGIRACPRLPTGGLVRWLGTRGELHKLIGSGSDDHRHFLYASSGPSIGQWLFAHGAGGRLVAGEVRLKDADDSLGHLRPGEVVELSVTSDKPAPAAAGQAAGRSASAGPGRGQRRAADARRWLVGLTDRVR